MGSVDVDSIADQLYALPPAEFTATRNTLVKQARAAGDRDTAAQIQALAKPTRSAWLVNRLARERADQLEPLIELGRDLREASANLTAEELRAMTRQRLQVVHALVQVARQLGGAEGQRVSDDVAEEVRQTLEASLADGDIADAVLSGRLSRPARYAGFGEPSGIDWHRSGAPRRTRSSGGQAAPAEVTDLDARRREQAEREVEQASGRLRAARTARDKAEQAAQKAQDAAGRASEDAERLRREVTRAEKAAAEAAKAAQAGQERLDRATSALSEAEQAHAEATARLEELRS
jgi:hypothetical protein